MYASQAGLSVVSNNIANANTPGYNKQDVILEILSPLDIGSGYMGMGVTVAGIKSTSDRFIQAQLYYQQQNMGRSSALEQSLSQIEQIFNEAKEAGLSSPIANFFDAWNDVATDPTSQAARNVLLQNADVLVLAAQRMENRINQTINESRIGIDDAVDQINTIADDIARLNELIVIAEAGQGERANDFRNQRDEYLNTLSALIENTWHEDVDGSITIAIGMRNLVAGTSTNTLSTTIDTSGNKNLFLDGINITSHVTMGKVSGLLSAGSEIQTGSLAGLRKLIASVTKEINLLHEQGYGLDGTTGNSFFSSLQVSTKNLSASASITGSITDITQVNLDEYSVSFSAGNYSVTDKQTGAVAISGAYVSGNPINFNGIQITITGAVTAADTFEVSPLTDAIKNFNVALSDANKVAAASAAGDLPGDNSMALQIAAITDTAISNLSSSTFTEFYQGLVTTVGSLSRAAADSSTFDENLLAEIKTRRDSASGVSLDEEAANLIRYQRAYEAGAKMIQVADELIQAVLNI